VVVAGVFHGRLDVFHRSNYRVSPSCTPTVPRDESQIAVVGSLDTRTRSMFAAFPDRGAALVGHIRAKRSYLLGTGVFVAASAAAPLPLRSSSGRGARGARTRRCTIDARLTRAVVAGVPAREAPHPIGSGPRSAGSPPPRPPLGGLLVQVSWRWVFIVNVPVGLASLIAGWRILREVRHPEAERPTSSARVCSPRGWRHSSLRLSRAHLGLGEPTDPGVFAAHSAADRARRPAHRHPPLPDSRAGAAQSQDIQLCDDCEPAVLHWRSPRCCSRACSS